MTTVKNVELVPNTSKKVKEIDCVNDDTLWSDTMFVEAQSQIHHLDYLFLVPRKKIPEGYQEVCLMTIFHIK
jgi:hypothetical protein